MALFALLMAGILWADSPGLGRALMRPADYPLPLGLLWFFWALSFASVRPGLAIMLRFEA